MTGRVVRCAWLATLLLACPALFAADAAPVAPTTPPQSGTTPEFHIAPIKPIRKRAVARKPARKKIVARKPADTPATPPRPATVVQDTATPATPADTPAGVAGAATGNTAAAPTATVAAPELRSEPPEDFAELLQPQRTAVDVYYAGEFLLTTLAEYTPDTIEFVEPAAVVAHLQNVVSRLALTNHLTGPQPRNSELVCRNAQQKNCGQLTPEFIGVIFDESRFRVDLFVHPEMLTAPTGEVSHYLPAPAAEHSGLSLVQNIDAVTRADSQGNNSHTIAGVTNVGSGMQHVYSTWYSTDYQGFSVEELAWQKDTHDYEYDAGLFRSHPGVLMFTRDEFLAGAGFGRSLKTRTDREQMLGNEIVIFLTSRSQVDIYKDGRLMSSRFYPAGKQVLDTSHLPSGAYDIEIRITDATGATRSQLRFFSRSNLFAPKGIPLFQAEAGMVVTPDRNQVMPQDTGNWQARGTWQYRYRDNVGLNLGAAATSTHALAEAGTAWLNPLFQAGAQAMVSTQGDHGISVHAFGRWHDLAGTISHRRVWKVWPPGSTTAYQLVDGSGTQDYATVSYPLFGGILQALADINESDTGSSELYSLRYLLPWRVEWMQTINFLGEVSNQDGKLFAQVGLELRQVGAHWSGGGNVGLSSQEMADGSRDTRATGSVDAGWRSGDLRPDNLEVVGRLSSDQTSTVAGIEGSDASHIGRIEAGVEQVDSGGLNDTRGFASYDTNLVATRDGVTFGGPRLAPSAVIVDIRGADRKTMFDVLVDGRRAASVPGGSRTVLPLDPYATYRIQLADRGTSFTYYDDKPRDVVMYPGNVQTLSWTVENVVVAVGRIILKEHVCSALDNDCHDVKVPLRSAMIGGTSGFAMTDEDGRFQAEMTASTRHITAKKHSIACDLALGDPRMVNGIADFGDVFCEPATTPAESPESTPENGQGADRARQQLRENDPVGGRRVDQASSD